MDDALLRRKIEVEIDLRAPHVSVWRYGIPYAAGVECCESHNQLTTGYALKMNELVD
jgi:hypothetical protein